MPSPSSMPNRLKESINRLERSGVTREIEHIKVSIERLEKMMEALSDQYSPYVQSLIDGSFEQGYEEGYNDGVEDGYSGKAEITEWNTTKK